MSGSARKGLTRSRMNNMCHRGREVAGDNAIKTSSGHLSCRECARKHTREWHRNNRSQAQAITYKAMTLRRAFVDAEHASGCVDCGNKNLTVLQSDHVRGTKIKDVAEMVYGNAPLAQLFDELAKCETRCANCHTIRTAERRREKRAVA